MQGCPEPSVNSLKFKAGTAAFPAKILKRPKIAEANFNSSFLVGETQASLETERLELLSEIGIRNNERVIAVKMAYTFAYRRQEVVNQEPSIMDVKDRWPAPFKQNEVITEPGPTKIQLKI